MKKNILTILLALLVGFFISKFLFNQYDKKEKIKTIFNNSETVYLLRQGIYSSKESMEENLSSFSYYIYNIEDELYYVYIGMTKDEDNYIKLEEYFKSLGYDTYKTEITVSNRTFLEILNQYDLLLKETEDKNIIKAICSQVLSNYEETVTYEYED